MSKLRANDGTPLGVFKVGESPFELAYDGENIWVTNLDSETVTKLRASDGSLQGTFRVGRQPSGICFDGEYIWVATSTTVKKVRVSDGAVLASQSLCHLVGDLASDGTHLWAVASRDLNAAGELVRLNLQNAAIERTYRTDEYPIGVLFDGNSIWVSNYFGNTVDKFSAMAP